MSLCDGIGADVDVVADGAGLLRTPLSLVCDAIDVAAVAWLDMGPAADDVRARLAVTDMTDLY